MTGKQKAVVIVVLGLVVLLSVVALGGGRAGTGDPNERNGFVEWLGSLGRGSTAVTADEISSDCALPDGGFAFTGSCELQVSLSGSGMKLLILRSDAPFQVEARGPGSSDFTMIDTVEPESGEMAEANIAIDPANGVAVVTLGCPVLEGCLLTLGDGSSDG